MTAFTDDVHNRVLALVKSILKQNAIRLLGLAGEDELSTSPTET